MRGPGQVNWDMSVFKNFVIKEKLEGAVPLRSSERHEHAAVLWTQRFVRQQPFGKITSQANFSRQLQLALRFSF